MLEGEEVNSEHAPPHLRFLPPIHSETGSHNHVSQNKLWAEKTLRLYAGGLQLVTQHPSAVVYELSTKDWNKISFLSQIKQRPAFTH